MNDNIEITGEAGNIYLATRKEDEGKQNIKCVTILNNDIDLHCTVNTYENISTPLTFNAFSEIEKEDRDDVKLVLSQRITAEDTEKINEFLK